MGIGFVVEGVMFRERIPMVIIVIVHVSRARAGVSHGGRGRQGISGVRGVAAHHLLVVVALGGKRIGTKRVSALGRY